VATAVPTDLTLNRLESHLWAAADLFRNKISNQKDYILALLFFKRASDLYDEAEAAAVARFVEKGAPEETARDVVKRDPSAWHTIIVPDGHSWNDVRNTDEHMLGQALNDALGAIGRANPKQLAGVFERTDFNNKNALPNEDLSKILDHFHGLGPLTSDRAPEDMLGKAYEWLIARFAATSGKAGGEFYTPAEVGRLCAVLLDVQPGETIYDPTCGSGGLLLQVLSRAEELHGEQARSIFVFGQELNPETWAIARMNMLLHGAGDQAEIERGDTLRDPAFRNSEGGIRQFDVVVANPPFSPKNWGHDWLKAGGDPFGRIDHLPPKSHGEMAFVQHMIASLDATGRMAVVLPNGVFFRAGAELAARKALIDSDLIEAVVQLPKDMFYGAGIPACLLICNRQKPEMRRGRVLFIDGSEGFERQDTKNVLRDTDLDRMRAAYLDELPHPAFSAFATAAELVDNGYNMTVRRYVRSGSDGDGPVDLAQAIGAYRAAIQDRLGAQAQVDEALRRLEADIDATT
jgi:type I restriction enzyme M protein